VDSLGREAAPYLVSSFLALTGGGAGMALPHKGYWFCVVSQGALNVLERLAAMTTVGAVKLDAL
jgi:hypothetical protein